MNEQRLRQHRHAPLLRGPSSPPRPPASAPAPIMPISTSQPDAPSKPTAQPSPPLDPSPLSPSAPVAESPRPLSFIAPSSSSFPSQLPTANPKPAPSATTATAIVASAADPDPPTTTATESAAPTKIPCRPRKTRKLATSFSPTAAGGTAAEARTAASPDAAAPGAVSNHARAVYRLPPRSLSAEGEVAAAIRHLRVADAQLAGVIDAHEPPVFQSLHPPFHALARSILYQQLALKAAASIYSRFLALCGGEDGVVPELVLGLTPHQLRQIGVSARKASYLHDLANKYRNGILSDASIAAMDDKSLFTMLNMVKGIGAWSVHMFMIFSLHRPDVLPVGDVGVRKGVQLLYGLDALPRPSQMEQLCEGWKPYRSVGSWYMWRLVEAKGMPAALATVSSGVAVAATADGGGVGGGISLVVEVPPPLPLPHLQLPIQQQYRPQLQHLQQHQHLHTPRHPHSQQQQQQHQHQQQRQLQIRPQLIDAMQSIPNLG